MTINNENLNVISKKGIQVPSYDRTNLKTGFVHIGMGNFHRSHFLTYMDMLLNMGLETEGVFEIDVVPSDPSFIEALSRQDYLYSVLSINSTGSTDLRINGPITGYANQRINSEKVWQVLVSPDTRLVSLTITEKGYCYIDSKKSLDMDNPDIKHDLLTDEDPHTAIGLLAKVLDARCKKDRLLTVMSCDNVPENGNMLRQCILQFMLEKYPDSKDWVEKNITFPCTMVDRITPGTAESDIKNLKEVFGIEDSCPIHCEDFKQWVIEKKASTILPDFSKAGAIMVDDVKSYELMKIRLLNGSHSALSYPAYMSGITMVHDAAIDEVIGKFIRFYYMEEISRTLQPVDGIDIDIYKDKLISRFSNPYIADTVLRLASDGSKKIENAIIRPLEETVERNLPNDAICLALALWLYYYNFKDTNGNPMPIDDPKGSELQAAASHEEIDLFLKIAGINVQILTIADKIVVFLKRIAIDGVKQTLENFMKKENIS